MSSKRPSRSRRAATSVLVVLSLSGTAACTGGSDAAPPTTKPPAVDPTAEPCTLLRPAELSSELDGAKVGKGRTSPQVCSYAVGADEGVDLQVSAFASPKDFDPELRLGPTPVALGGGTWEDRSAVGGVLRFVHGTYGVSLTLRVADPTGVALQQAAERLGARIDRRLPGRAVTSPTTKPPQIATTSTTIPGNGDCFGLSASDLSTALGTTVHLSAPDDPTSRCTIDAKDGSLNVRIDVPKTDAKRDDVAPLPEAGGSPPPAGQAVPGVGDAAVWAPAYPTASAGELVVLQGSKLVRIRMAGLESAITLARAKALAGVVLAHLR